VWGDTQLEQRGAGTEERFRRVIGMQLRRRAVHDVLDSEDEDYRRRYALVIVSVVS
jgi:hypothetical protein